MDRKVGGLQAAAEKGLDPPGMTGFPIDPPPLFHLQPPPPQDHKQLGN